MSTIQTIINVPVFTATPNSYTYFTYTPTSISANAIFNLADPAVQLGVIYIINNSTFSVTVNDNLGSLLGVMPSNTNSVYLPNHIEGGWTQISSSATSVSTSNSGARGNALIPALTSNTSNKDFWSVTGSGQSTGNEFYRPFSSDSTTYWLPTSTGPERLDILSPYVLTSSTPILVKAITILLRGASSTNYFNGVSLSGSNDGVTFTNLYSFTNTQMQTGDNMPLYITLNNGTPYNIYRLSITSTIGSLSVLGFRVIQLFGGFI